MERPSPIALDYAAPTEARVSGAAWAMLVLLFLASALSFLDRQVLSTLAPDLMRELRMDDVQYSRVVSAFVFTYTIMFTAGGWMVDRIGTRLGLALSVAVWSVASAAHALCHGPWGLGGARMLLGLGEGACFPAATKGACEWFPPQKRAMAIGMATGGSAFGAVIAPPLTAFIAGRFGWRAAFIATGVMGAAWVGGWVVASLAQRRGETASGSAAPFSAPAALAVQPQSPPVLEYAPPPTRADLLRQPAVWRILAARFLFDPVFYFYMFWIPQYLSRERGFSVQRIGALLWIPFLALGISNLAAGHISDALVRRGWSLARARSVLLLLSAAITPVSCLVAFAHTAPWALALMSCLMVAHGLWICNFLAHISDRFPAAVVGTVVGLSGTVGGTAGILANLAIGLVVNRFSFAPIFAVSAVLYPAAYAVLHLRAAAPRGTGWAAGNTDR